MSQVTRFENMDVDAFDLYIEATKRFGDYRVFLLDSLHGPVKTRYEMSLLGILPLVEIQVKSGIVHVYAEDHIGKHIRDQLESIGFYTSEADYLIEVPSSDKQTEYKSAVVTPGVHYSIERDPIIVLDFIRKVMKELLIQTDSTPFSCGFLGYFGYDAIHYLENLPKTVIDDRNLADIRIQFHGAIVQLVNGKAILFNHVDGLAHIIPEAVRTQLSHDIGTLQNIIDTKATIDAYLLWEQDHDGVNSVYKDIHVEEDVSEELFKNRVQEAKEYILSGDIFQIVISKRVRVEKRIHPYRAYARLRAINPSPYMFMGEYPDMRLFGASPEVQFRAVDGQAQMKPIAGTSKGRGLNEEEDAGYRERLLNNIKDNAEHIMLVDLCRNDLGRVCNPGTVLVKDLMAVESYAHLFHLVSTVDGVLKENTNIFHALLATFPAGTLSGAPKIRAMEIIDELEDVARGPYGGFVGMVDLYGNANTAIIIRSVIEAKDTYYVQAGAGIVADSDANEEWEECGRKARAVIQVLVGAE